MPTTAALDRVAELVSQPGVVKHGYLDVLGDEPPRQRTLALAAMRSRALPLIYERWWRPVVRLANGRHDQAAEQKIARTMLELHSGQTVLDVACGPGNFTRSFAPHVGPEGLIIGFDESKTMLAKAVESTTAPEVGYVRGDARRLPFPDGSFDAVGCFLALHLIPEPFRALDEMIRVLAPGARIVVHAPYLPPGLLPRIVDRTVNAPIGIRAFSKTEFTDAFTRAGLVDVRQKITGLFQFVAAARRQGTTSS